MLNGKYRVFSLEYITDKVMLSKYYITTGTVGIISIFFIFNSLSFYIGLLIGIMLTLLLEIYFVYYFLGFSSNDVVIPMPLIDSPKIGPISEMIDVEDLAEVAEEENKNDVKILYRSICDKNREEGFVKKIYVDQNYYCKCKFNPDNITSIAKLRGDSANKYAQNIVNFNNLRCHILFLFNHY
jgi:hypothetical protein